MDQRGDRGRSLHGVRQPGVQAELRRFAHGADEQQDADDGERVAGDAEGLELRGGEVGRGGEDLVEAGAAEQHEGAADAEREADIARSEEQTSELQSLMSISYAVFCLKKK